MRILYIYAEHFQGHQRIATRDGRPIIMDADYVTIVGQNMRGKSTILRAIQAAVSGVFAYEEHISLEKRHALEGAGRAGRRATPDAFLRVAYRVESAGGGESLVWEIERIISLDGKDQIRLRPYLYSDYLGWKDSGRAPKLSEVIAASESVTTAIETEGDQAQAVIMDHARSPGFPSLRDRSRAWLRQRVLGVGQPESFFRAKPQERRSILESLTPAARFEQMYSESKRRILEREKHVRSQVFEASSALQDSARIIETLADMIPHSAASGSKERLGNMSVTRELRQGGSGDPIKESMIAGRQQTSAKPSMAISAAMRLLAEMISEGSVATGVDANGRKISAARSAGTSAAGMAASAQGALSDSLNRLLNEAKKPLADFCDEAEVYASSIDERISALRTELTEIETGLASVGKVSSFVSLIEPALADMLECVSGRPLDYTAAAAQSDSLELEIESFTACIDRLSLIYTKADAFRESAAAHAKSSQIAAAKARENADKALKSLEGVKAAGAHLSKAAERASQAALAADDVSLETLTEKVKEAFKSSHFNDLDKVLFEEALSFATEDILPHVINCDSFRDDLEDALSRLLTLNSQAESISASDLRASAEKIESILTTLASKREEAKRALAPYGLKSADSFADILAAAVSASAFEEVAAAEASICANELSAELEATTHKTGEIFGEIRSVSERISKLRETMNSAANGGSHDHAEGARCDHCDSELDLEAIEKAIASTQKAKDDLEAEAAKLSEVPALLKTRIQESKRRGAEASETSSRLRLVASDLAGAVFSILGLDKATERASYITSVTDAAFDKAYSAAADALESADNDAKSAAMASDRYRETAMILLAPLRDVRERYIKGCMGVFGSPLAGTQTPQRNSPAADTFDASAMIMSYETAIEIFSELAETRRGKIEDADADEAISYAFKELKNALDVKAGVARIANKLKTMREQTAAYESRIKSLESQLIEAVNAVVGAGALAEEGQQIISKGISELRSDNGQVTMTNLESSSAFIFPVLDQLSGSLSEEVALLKARKDAVITELSSLPKGDVISNSAASLRGNLLKMEGAARGLALLSDEIEALTLCSSVVSPSGYARTLAMQRTVAQLVERTNEHLQAIGTHKNLSIDLKQDDGSEGGSAAVGSSLIKPRIEIEFFVDGQPGNLPSKSQDILVGFCMDRAVSELGEARGVLLFDEPEAFLDEVNKQRVMDYLPTLSEQVIVASNSATSNFPGAIAIEVDKVTPAAAEVPSERASQQRQTVQRARLSQRIPKTEDARESADSADADVF